MIDRYRWGGRTLQNVGDMIYSVGSLVALNFQFLSLTVNVYLSPSTSVDF